MRALLLLRGIPGSGKSTFIKKHKLEPFTIEPDAIRLMFHAPYFSAMVNKFQISQKYDKQVFQFIEERLVEKMTKGEFIVMDGMNISLTANKNIAIKLAKKFNYEVYVYEMSTDLNTCLKQNLMREEYKQVPTCVIFSAYERLKNASAADKNITFLKDEDLDKFFNPDPIDFNHFNNVVVFGDIHGCYNEIKKYFKHNPYDEKTAYIFTGDLLDRGPKNKETLEFFLKFYLNENVFVLEGNHSWERFYAKGQIDLIRSKEFLNNTMNDIKSINKKDIETFTDTWLDHLYISFKGNKYFITHAGIGKFPTSMLFISSYEMIKGFSYSDDVDKLFNENEKDIIQIHGHRNLYNYEVNTFANSLNLNSKVEFGEDLRFVTL